MNTTNPTAQMVTHDQIAPDKLWHPSEQLLVAEIVACLVKYQARYAGVLHAKKLWLRADIALKAWAQTNVPADVEAHKVRAEDTPA